MFSFTHLIDRPILHVDDDPRFEGNINGPSLIKIPDWVPNPLGRYYLYFAHHEGKSIRLAYADQLTGPWVVYWPGALSLTNSGFPTEPPLPHQLHHEAADLIASGQDGTYPHIASPDVMIDDQNQELRMYFHGRLADGRQRTRVAVSKDGLLWQVNEPILGHPYFRVFQHDGSWYSLTMPGFICRSADGLAPFDETGPIIFGNGMRHSALLKRGNQLHVFWSRIGDWPERILHTAIDLWGNWRSWSAGNPVPFNEIHRPTKVWEGANLPNRPSKGGSSMAPVNQLRDPAIFEEDGKIYLLYSVQGEQGIGIGKLLI